MARKCETTQNKIKREGSQKKKTWVEGRRSVLRVKDYIQNL